MSLRTKLFLSFVIILLLIITLLSMNSFNANSEKYQIKRLLWINHQYTALLNLKIAVNQQLSEAQKIFLYGKEADLHHFQEITELVKKEVNTLVDAESMEGASGVRAKSSSAELRRDRDRLLVIQHSYEDLNRELVLLSQLIQVGRNRKAREHFQTEIGRKFKVFFGHIDTWTAMEERKLAEVEKSFVSLSWHHNIATIIGLSVILVMVLVFFVIFVYILGPRLKELLRGTKRISAGDFAQPVEERGNDEISNLALAMNQMMRSLADSRKKILEQSYYSGMADMVSGILHNVKNALLPVVVDVEVMQEELGAIDCANISKAVVQLGRPETTAAKQKEIGEYVELSAHRIEGQLVESLSTLKTIAHKIALIDQVLSEHNKFAGAERPLESVSLDELLKDSISLVRKNYLENVEFSLELGAFRKHAIKTQRIVMIQVLANLINNAIESILRSGISGGKVIVSVEEDEDSSIHIMVIDNGQGIEKEKISQIFQRGVSSKSGSFGLGLHWCANAVASLQGKLSAESGGIGQGACLHLILKR